MRRAFLASAWLLSATSPAAAGQFDPPSPQAFIRTEDQQRARLLNTPCTPADLGRGCYRYDNRLIREIPCTLHSAPGVLDSLPLDQCYKMEEPRRYRGIWIDEFEGQAFLPEGASPPERPRGDPRSPGWREQAERARAARTWLDVSRTDLRHDFRPEGRRVRLDFVGRKTLYPGAYGHMGGSANEIIVDRVISAQEQR
ncbi:hypothetical protein [Sphingomonas aracearum]|uniref:Uncharacterized protein n=1 Tax=Sphingomonas aracearum TaxID=2283317 RepID=A0A369VTE5_9SPHN|nr:hypothetical protein [Sphingomonas aracearum]RDE04817.1 hypothetical protein DVW87_14680 [Sphingomonas aracearum]